MESRVSQLALLAVRLTALAEKGLLHGDLKPAHVRMDPVEGPRIIDWGAARWNQGPPLQNPSCTPGSCAPERLSGQAPTEASEVWSLGALAWELLCGRPLYGELEAPARAWHSLHSLPGPASAWQPEVDPVLDELLLRAMARYPEARPSLEEVAAGLGAWAPAPAARPRVGQHRGREAIRRALVGFMEGQGALLYVTAPLGGGVNAALTELGRLARLQGMAVLDQRPRPGPLPEEGPALVLRWAADTPDLAAALHRARQRPRLLLALGSDEARPGLEALDVRVVALEPMDLDAVALWARATGCAEPPARLLERCGGWPGRLWAGLGLGPDRSEAEQGRARLLHELRHGPVQVAELARRLNLGRLDLLDLAEELLLNGQVLEVERGRALRRAR
jgi:hypothetical protein